MKSKTLQLQFYTKPDCPLCDEAKSVLKNISVQLSFIAIEEIDITKNLGLFTKYKLKIPVLEMDGKQLFAHRVDAKKLVWQLRCRRFLRRFSRK